jgi:hypothetical protein
VVPSGEMNAVWTVELENKQRCESLQAIFAFVGKIAVKDVNMRHTWVAIRHEYVKH